MFANLLQFLTRRPTRDYDSAFVRDVHIRRRIARSRRSEQLLLVCWILIAIKSVLMFWMVDHYRMPFDAWWIVAPTWAAAAICTWIYWRRE